MEMIEDETAQVILIGGFLIAIGVVSAILMLNNISYSQTITSQNGDSGDFGPLEFADSTERAVSEAMTGNGTTPGNASTEFEEYLKSYSDRANEVVSEEGVSAGASTQPTTDINEAWMVGQRANGNFQNATGENEWIMIEDIPSPEDENNIRGRFELNVSGMSSPDPDPFVLRATNEDNFATLSTVPTSASGFDAYELKMEINETVGGDNFLNLTMHALRNNSVITSGLDVVSDDKKEINVTGDETVTVDVFDETVNGDTSKFPQPTGPSVDTDNVDGFKFKNGSDGVGMYDFRFDGSPTGVDESNFGTGGTSTGEPRGPCAGDGPPCRTVDGTEKHIVGVVHSITGDPIELNYVSRSTSYSKKIGGMVLDADDVNLNEIKNVDNASYFDVEITNNPSPVEEGTSSIDVGYDITNTGTLAGTQNVTLKINGKTRAWTGDLSLDGVGGSDPDDTDTLSWSNPSPNGTYTAYLISENTTDTVQVSVDKSSGPGIPDGPVGFALPSPVLETLAGVTQR
jgi:hypothetical protein